MWKKKIDIMMKMKFTINIHTQLLHTVNPRYNGPDITENIWLRTATNV
jgi:hypothetical protein